MSDRVHKAAEKVVEQIDAHKYSGGSVPQEETIEFLETIITSCQERVDLIKSEMSSARKRG